MKSSIKIGLLTLVVAAVVATLSLTTDRYHVVYTVYTAQPDGTYREHQRSVTVYDYYMPNEQELAWDDAEENCTLTVDSVSVDKFFCNDEEIELE